MVTQELITYIEKMRVSGQSDEQIKSVLFDAGWSEIDIEQAMIGKFISKSAPVKSGAPNKFLIVIIFLFGFFIIAFGGAAYFFPSVIFPKKNIDIIEEEKKVAMEIIETSTAPETASPSLEEPSESLSSKKEQLDACKKEKFSKFNELKASSENFKFPFEPIYAYGAVNYPIDIDFSILNVNYGIFDVSNLHSDGSFCLILNKKQEGGALINVMNENGIVLQYVVVNPFEDQNITINVDTTASALIYMSLGVSSPDSQNAKITMDYINNLKETSEFSAVLQEKLSERNVFLEDALSVTITNLNNAVQALIQKVRDCNGLIDGCIK